MRFLISCVLLISLFGCSTSETLEFSEGVEAEVSSAPPVEGLQTAESFDPDDVASIRESRDRWVAAFEAGNADALSFIFSDDAVMTLPDSVSLLTGEEFFERYTVELVIDESSERFMADGGDPRKMTKLPWVSYLLNYTLTLSPKIGGELLESSDRLMTRFHRQQDDSLKVIRGPSVGNPAPLFALNDMRGGGEVQLASLIGEKPTILIFGSYT